MIHSGRCRKAFLAIVLCLSALVAAPKALYSAVQKEVQCTLSVPASRIVSGQSISISLSITNTSAQTLFVPWPSDTHHLLQWGVLSVSIKDESGKTYKYVPRPSRFFPRQRSHYQRLTPGNGVRNSFNLCWFRDDNYSHSPCSRPGKYVVRATYSNDSADYWDAGANKWVELSEVCTGKTTCNEIKIEVIVKELVQTNLRSQQAHQADSLTASSL